MDPNTALEQAREACKDFDKAQKVSDMASLGNDLVTLFQGLDEWLSRDGFLPDDWRSEEEKADPSINDRNALIVGALRELPWGEDVDINGGDLVDLVGQLLEANVGRDTLTALKQRAKEQFNPDEDEEWTRPPAPGDSCQFGPTMGLITHRRWGGPGDCDEYEHGVITDGATGKVIGRLGEGNFA